MVLLHVEEQTGVSLVVFSHLLFPHHFFSPPHRLVTEAQAADELDTGVFYLWLFVLMSLFKF